MKKHFLFSIIFVGLVACQGVKIDRNVPELLDNNPTTHYIGNKKTNLIVFDKDFQTPILSYKIYSSGEEAKSDPSNWTLKGSNDGKDWTIVDQQTNKKFCSRYQEILCHVEKPYAYTQYMLEAKTANGDTLKIGDVAFFTEDLLANWKDFNYPKVNFKRENPETLGDTLYHQLVQNPDEYVKYHTQKVAEVLFFSAQDTMNDVQQINYVLRDYEGISSKSGEPPVVSIQYSTQHVEKSAKESMYKLDYETRGVLYHELVHAYQFEPKNIGSYGTNKTFWACIEGMADAVRAEAGLFDIDTMRKPGGNWMDGYKTTGFFIQWLKTKDPDAIRKFHLTVRDLETWSFDGAMKSMFGNNASIESVWQEYQEYLEKKINL